MEIGFTRKGFRRPMDGSQPPSFSSSSSNNSDDRDDGGGSGANKFVVDDFYQYLLGAWKRNLEWREYGGLFQHIRTSNTVVLIEEYNRLESEPGTRFLRWSFGKTLQKTEMRFGYEMKVVNSPKANETYLSWQYIGTQCHGRYFHGSNVAILNFFLRNSVVTVNYRIIDENSMAVCIVEVDDKSMPTIQYGNMYRIDPTSYKK